MRCLVHDSSCEAWKEMETAPKKGRESFGVGWKPSPAFKKKLDLFFVIPKWSHFLMFQTLSTLKSQTLIARARLRANVPQLALDIPRMAANVLRVGCRKAMRSPGFSKGSGFLRNDLVPRKWGNDVWSRGKVIPPKNPGKFLQMLKGGGYKRDLLDRGMWKKLGVVFGFCFQNSVELNSTPNKMVGRQSSFLLGCLTLEVNWWVLWVFGNDPRDLRDRKLLDIQNWKLQPREKYWVVVSNIFYFHPLFGEDSHFD